MQKMQIKNEVKVYAAPSGAVLQDDYFVNVRTLGEKEWISVPVYQVKVDMHDKRYASMCYFDFCGSVEIEVRGPFYIGEATIRPLSKNIVFNNDTKRIHFVLNHPENLSIELNKNRYHNLHLFTGKINDSSPDRNEAIVNEYVYIKGDMEKSGFLSADIFRSKEFEEKRKIWISPGIFYVDECVMSIPSDVEIYLEGGTIIIGGFICADVKNVKIWGPGIFYQGRFERFNGINGIRISKCQNIEINNLIFINPCHYTVHLGQSENICIFNIKSFSCEGWSDGIDMMSCKHIHIKGGFLRNSDDCIAIYGSRWEYVGNSEDILVEDIILWADVAHPTMIGTHGNYSEDGDKISHIRFQNIEILEHNEPQAGYLGCLAINAGDKNLIEDVLYENINIEPFLHGKVFDIQVRWNKDYNPAPGKMISDIRLNNIFYSGSDEIPSEIKGYSDGAPVKDVIITNYYRHGKLCNTMSEANINVGRYTSNVVID